MAHKKINLKKIKGGSRSMPKTTTKSTKEINPKCICRNNCRLTNPKLVSHRTTSKKISKSSICPNIKSQVWNRIGSWLSNRWNSKKWKNWEWSRSSNSSYNSSKWCNNSRCSSSNSSNSSSSSNSNNRNSNSQSLPPKTQKLITTILILGLMSEMCRWMCNPAIAPPSRKKLTTMMSHRRYSKNLMMRKRMSTTTRKMKLENKCESAAIFIKIRVCIQHIYDINNTLISAKCPKIWERKKERKQKP